MLDQLDIIEIAQTTSYKPHFKLYQRGLILGRKNNLPNIFNFFFFFGLNGSRSISAFSLNLFKYVLTLLNRRWNGSLYQMCQEGLVCNLFI